MLNKNKNTNKNNNANQNLIGSITSGNKLLDSILSIYLSGDL